MRSWTFQPCIVSRYAFLPDRLNGQVVWDLHGLERALRAPNEPAFEAKLLQVKPGGYLGQVRTDRGVVNFVFNPRDRASSGVWFRTNRAVLAGAVLSVFQLLAVRAESNPRETPTE